MKSLIPILVFLFLLVASGSAQDSVSDQHYNQLEEKYRHIKDSLALLHPLIPAVSSVVLHYQQLEIIFYNSLITADKIRNNQGELTDLGLRVSYFYSTFQFTYGVSKNSRFNVGLDVNAIAGRVDEDENSSPLKVFDTQVGGRSQYARAVTSFGPRIRWRPFKGDYRFTVQSSLSFPTGIPYEKEQVLGPDRIYFLAQALYNQPLSKRMFLFTQLSLQYGGQKSINPSILITPLAAYLSFLIPKKTILFALFNYVPIFTQDKNWNYSRYTFQIGGGVQYQISKKFLVNGYYTNDIKGKNYQGFSNYNLSIRYASR